MWAGCVHHSWRFGHAEALREVYSKISEHGSKTSTVPCVGATFGIFSTRSKWFPVGRYWWQWTKPGFITMTQKQSNNQWIGGIASHPTPKIPSAILPWKNSRLDYLGWRRHSPHLFFPKAIITTWCITHLCWCNWRTFWRTYAGRGKVTNGVLFLHDKVSAHRALANK